MRSLNTGQAAICGLVLGNALSAIQLLSCWITGAKDGHPPSFSCGGRHREELLWREDAGSHAREEDGAFEVEGLVDAGSDGGAARGLRGELEFAGTLELVIDIVAEGFSVVDGGDAIPLAERMQQFAIQKGTALAVGGGEAVEAPLAVDDADLKEHAVGG